MAIVSISLPDSLLATADHLIDKRGYSGRSEFVRAAVRDFLVANPLAAPSGNVSATVTLVYPEGREKEFSKLRHEFGDTIRTLIHGHAGESCLEVFVLEGKADRIQTFGDALRGTRSAVQVSLIFAQTVLPETAEPSVAHKSAKVQRRR